MTPEELRAALDATAPADAVAAAALAARVRAEVQALPARAIELAAGPAPALALKARILVGRLDDLAATAALDAPAPADPSAAVWAIGAATAAAVGLRSRIAERLRPMLADRRPLPAGPADPRVEEPVRPRRVCDEAYACFRELVHIGESRSTFVMDRWAFFRLPESERDAEIARALAGEPFTRLLDDREA